MPTKSQPLRILAVVVVALAAVAVVYSPITCDDHWWHLLTGRYLLDHGAVPSTDPFSFTYQGKPWVNWEWLGGLVMVLGFDALGEAGLVALRFVAVFGTLSLVGWHLWTLDRRESAGRLPAVLLLVGLCLLVIFGRVGDRPHLYALPLVASAHLLATRAARRRDARSTLAPFVMMCFWVPLHPSWILGVAVHTAVLADSWIEDRAAWRVGKSRLDRWFVVGSPLLLLVPALVVHRPGDYASAVARLFGAGSLTEWQPLWSYLHWTNTPLLAFLALSLMWLGSLWVSPRRLRLPSTWLVAALLIASFRYVRFTPELAILATPPIDTALGRRWDGRIPPRTAALATVLLAALLALVVLESKATFGLPFSVEVNARENPVRTAAFMQRYQLGGNLLASDLNVHAYLAFARYPEVRGYIDGRVPQVFPESFLLEYRRALADPKAFAALLDDNPIDQVVLMGVFSPRTARLASVLSARGDFELVHLDDDAMLWTRLRLLDSLELRPPAYRYLIPPLIDDDWFARALAPAVFPAVVAELARLLDEQPGSQIGETLRATLEAHPGTSAPQRAQLRALAAARK